MHCTDVETITAKKQHKCTSCGEAIEAGEQYKKWVSFDDGAFTNKMHPECLAMHDEDEDNEGGTWEYMPYSHDRPERRHPHRTEGATAMTTIEPQRPTRDEVRDLVKECGLDWQRGFAALFDGDDTNRYEVLVRAAIEQYAAERRAEERKPLTDEQIIDATESIDTSRNGYFIHIARAIERAHGIGEQQNG